MQKIKIVTVQCRLEERHERLLLEIAQKTGLRTTSAVLRLLIENARIELRPQPVSVLELPANQDEPTP